MKWKWELGFIFGLLLLGVFIWFYPEIQDRWADVRLHFVASTDLSELRISDMAIGEDFKHSQTISEIDVEDGTLHFWVPHTTVRTNQDGQITSLNSQMPTAFTTLDEVTDRLGGSNVGRLQFEGMGERRRVLTYLDREHGLKLRIWFNRHVSTEVAWYVLEEWLGEE